MKKAETGKYQCPCCGSYTIEEPGSYEICPVCHWEDDPIQTENPDLDGGANRVSLYQAKESYILKRNKGLPL